MLLLPAQQYFGKTFIAGNTCFVPSREFSTMNPSGITTNSLLVANDILGGFRVYKHETSDKIIYTDNYNNLIDEIKNKLNPIGHKKILLETKLNLLKLFAAPT